MRKMKCLTLAIGLLALVSIASAQDVVNVPMGGGADGIDGLKLVTLSGVKASLQSASGEDGIKVSFKKTGEERRFIALEARPQRGIVGAKAAEFHYKLALSQGSGARLALMIFEKGGASWYRVAPEIQASDAFVDGRVSLSGMRKTSFSETTREAPAFDKFEKVWFGIVLDGMAEGSLNISRAVFTSEPYRPSKPLNVTGDGPGQWSIGQDPAVKSNLTTPNEGPDGKACMKVEFTFPLGRHMYMIPSTPVLAQELDGYSALRFTYKASLPQGIIGAGLLITLGERSGAQYSLAPEPAPKATSEWKTVTIPFSEFKLAGWSKDDNNHFDTDQIGSVMIGCHGSATSDEGKGTIWVSDVQFVP